VPRRYQAAYLVGLWAASIACAICLTILVQRDQVSADPTPLFAVDTSMVDPSAVADPRIQSSRAPATPAAVVAAVAEAPATQPQEATVRPAIASPSSVVADAEAPIQFNGRPVRVVRTQRMLVTAYCPCAKCCGKHADGKTASGYSVWTNGSKFVAADKRMFQFGELLGVPGYDGGAVVPVLDRGRLIKGHRLDVFYPSHEMAKQWGSRWLDVKVYEYTD
jgi:3D (Asp-Asp-Asp) domain-containing protein